MSWERNFSFIGENEERDLSALYDYVMGNVQTSMSTPRAMPVATSNVQVSRLTPLSRRPQASTPMRDLQMSTTPSNIAPSLTRNLNVSTTSTPETVSTSTSTSVSSHRSVYSVYGRPPASRWSVETLPRETIVEKEGACVICLMEWQKRDVAAELPCKHEYHFECVNKWLEIHATCPQCRYEMPLEGEDDMLKNVEVDDDDDDDDDCSDDYDSDSDE